MQCAPEINYQSAKNIKMTFNTVYYLFVKSYIKLEVVNSFKNTSRQKILFATSCQELIIPFKNPVEVMIRNGIFYDYITIYCGNK